MALTPGTRLGVYEITAQIGEGGMGQVYRATDTRLKRQVAIKILPPSMAEDANRLARFQREAEVLASLNHRNIGGVYGIEESGNVRALVMELVEGDDLSQRISRGAMPLDEALPVAKQIAEALEAAHEQGIIHRDLKPANVKVRPDGAVKVLDFGLAKTMEPAAGSSMGLSMSPTLTTPAMTHAGMILGTAAYMAPEQARGKTVDRRADIWAFGCVLYEMLTGRRTFAGDEVADVLASVLARDPDLAALPANTPPSIRRLLRRCLEKDRNERLSDAGDARIEIRDALAKADPEGPVVRSPGADRYSRERLAWIGALGLALATALMLALRPAPTASEMRVDISTPPTTAPLSLAISPDGRTIAFVATAEGQSRLWLRSLESGSMQAVKATDGAASPFWSPDNRSVGFFADGMLKRLDVDGGSVRPLAAAPKAQSGTWNRDGVVLFASLGTPISRVPATGGEPVALSGLAQQGSDFSPHFLPDGRRFLYYLRAGPEARGVYVGQLDQTLEPRRLLDSDSGAVYAPSGHLLFVHQGNLFAQRFDPVRLELAGNSFPVAEQAASEDLAGPSVSDEGAIAFRHSAAGAKRQFVWFDRSGHELGPVGESVSTTLSAPSLSLDGRLVAMYRPVDGNVDIYLLDTRRGGFSRVTTDAADDVMPVLSPDGSRIVFSSNRNGSVVLYQKSVTGGGNEELLLPSAAVKVPLDWSTDGRFLLFNSQGPKGSLDIWALHMDGSGKSFPVAQTSAEEQRGQFSPGGDWIAYQSNELGHAEIYVQPFPGPGSKWPISINGGSQVRWRGDGKELFYVGLDGRLMAVSFQVASAAQAPEVGAPFPLFAPALGGALQQGDFRHQYMVSADGQKFLVATVTEEASSPITLILNWKPRR